VAARYAHPALCNLLLDLRVDATAYDDRLWTPLDHLAAKIGIGFSCPARVTDTIRALVQRGGCQPLYPLTSNTVTRYRGPEEGFAWLFNNEYEGVDIEARDTEGWTPLCEAAYTFGHWIRLGVEDSAASWQSLYLLRAGADRHSTSAEGRLTPLDAFLRGCTHNHVDNARRWLDVLITAGVDLHEYADTEREMHGSEHLLKSAWDSELWKWIPIRQRVMYEYGKKPEQLQIWLEDYDALCWFNYGRYDLEIFLVQSPHQSIFRWKEIHARRILDDDDIPDIVAASSLGANGRERSRWLLYVIGTLLVNYFLHIWMR
jgi:hypothetical protein